ncbi:MAG: NADH-quinone oxidoreductase subunit A [Verrucomicrobia bacterium]|nr:NADH-quinone oxidoreductase subunit A [Verrucomicrobiota bacterium]
MKADLDIFYLGFMALVGVGYVLGSFWFSRLIAPSAPDAKKTSPYECGEIPFGGAWGQFNVGYYIFALLFLVFDVEVIFLFPWAVVLKKVGVFALVEGAVFLAILVFGLVYAWRKKYLVWQ